LQELAEDIAEHGLREPIGELPDGRIIDGCKRYRACQIAGVEPRLKLISARIWLPLSSR
jgi:ParB-like chromosome segregation protein Spo0J